MDIIIFEEFLKSLDLIPQQYYNGTIYIIDNVIVLQYLILWSQIDILEKHFIKDQVHIVSWEPEGHFCRWKMFRWEPEERYCHTFCTAIGPFWFSTGHLWYAKMPFWLSTDGICAYYTDEVLRYRGGAKRCPVQITSAKHGIPLILPGSIGPAYMHWKL